jgi:hypothetical protein
LRFPSLKSLNLGCLSTPAWDKSTFLTKFLIAHPDLQHFPLGSGLDFADQYEGITGADSLMGGKTFPSLRSFETHLTNLSIMVRNRVKCLQQLERLLICTAAVTSLLKVNPSLSCSSP